MKFAKVNNSDNSLVEIKELTWSDVNAATQYGSGKEQSWLEVVEDVDPSFDARTHYVNKTTGVVNGQWKIQKATVKYSNEIIKGVIKSQAGSIIESNLPDWKQRNSIARAVELVGKKQDGGTLTADEQTQEAQINALWAWVKDVRLHSDSLEADIDADNPINIDTGWPSFPS